ncbi:MAG: hypothetical protein ABW167_11655 [Baekduia sp.]
MAPWLALLTRELALLVVLTVIGLGPVALLHRSVDRASRLALAPAFGLAVCACVLATTLWRVPAYRGWPLLVALMVASVALAVLLGRRADAGAPQRSPLRLARREVVQLVVVIGFVLGALNVPLWIAGSAGPVGGYRIADAVGYVAEIDGAQRESLHAAKQERPPWHDLTIQNWSGTARGFQQIGFDAVAAHTNELLGLHATDTHAAFLICLILVGALAAWATVRLVTVTRSWAAVLAAALFAGPFFRTLSLEGSQGAISGIVLVIPTLLAAWWVVRFQRFWDLLALGVLAAGLQTLYPLFVPPLVIGGALVLAGLAVRAARRGALSGAAVARAAGMLVAVLAIAAAVTPVAFDRNVRYWKAILRGDVDFSTLPAYDLPAPSVPSWLLQARELYFLPSLHGQPLSQLLVSIVIPLILLAVIVYGVRRHRVALAGLAVIAGAVVLANRTATADSCSYCAQRNLLVVAPVAMALIGIGVAALRARGGRLALIALGVAGLTVVAVASMARHTVLRTLEASYVFEEQINVVLKHLPDQRGPVEVEGFGQLYLAPMAEPLAYDRVNEVTDAPVSIPMEQADFAGLLYLGGARPIGVEFRPDYRYVLTRVPDVAVPTRRTIARSGHIALQERTGDLDVTVTSGFATPEAYQPDPATAWVRPATAMRFWVIGGSAKPAWLQVRLKATVPVKVDGGALTVSSAGQAVTSRSSGGEVIACTPVGGPPPVRRADLYFTFTPEPQRPLESQYAAPDPRTGVELTAMSVSSRSCRGAAR